MIIENVQHIIEYFRNYIIILKSIYWIISTEKIFHYNEICYIAKRIHMNPFEILLIQIFHEIYSVTVLKVQGQELFSRTMNGSTAWC